MGYEHPSTTPETESDKVIESSVKNLVQIPSEYEVNFDNESECDVPVKNESSPVCTTFANPLFDCNDDFTSSDDELLSNKDVPMENFKFYGFAVNRESALDVYSKRRIIAVTELKIVEWHNYKHLDWISIRHDYKFKEGDFKRLHLQNIEDMLLLLVQGKLSNLTVEEHFAFNVSLRMFTRSIVIQRRVEDLQLGVKSYQKRLNLTKPDMYRPDLKRCEAYTAYSNPRGFIYQNKDKKNRLMRIDELHKFSDGTLNDVRNALDDRLKGIRMQYLPTTIWRIGDKDRAAAMIQSIDKMLKTRRIMRSLEKIVTHWFTLIVLSALRRSDNENMLSLVILILRSILMDLQQQSLVIYRKKAQMWYFAFLIEFLLVESFEVLQQDGHPAAYLSRLLAPRHKGLSTDLFKRIKASWEVDPSIQQLITKVKTSGLQILSMQNDQLRRNGKLVIRPGVNLRQELVKYYHDEPMGFHYVEANYKRLKVVFYWKGMKWTLKSIEGLPSSYGKIVIFMIIDRLMYGQSPSTHVSYMVGDSYVEDVDRSLLAKEADISLLQFHLEMAQHKMKVFATRSDKEFLVGDWEVAVEMQAKYPDFNPEEATVVDTNEISLTFALSFPGSFAIFQPYRISDHSSCMLWIPMICNLHDRVNRLHVELDEAQKAIDRDPSCSTLRDEHAHYLLVFKEASLDEERFLRQKAKVEWLNAGDSNMAYFHRMDTSKCMRNRIDMGMIKPMGQMVLLLAFFKKAWDTVGRDVTCAIKEFFANGKLLKELNHTIVSLIPKVSTPAKINDYRPISCCNVLYKCISKIIANQIKVDLGDLEFKNVSGLVSSIPTSTAFFYNVLVAFKASILSSMPFDEGTLPVRLQLIIYVLSSMHIYWASVFILPMRIAFDLEQLMHGFLWYQGDMKKGKAKVAWDSICKPKEEGGL
nr:hypothetical protein [Tanacetum cinerariifolium]